MRAHLTKTPPLPQVSFALSKACGLVLFLGRTIPSFRLALADEQSQWSEYRKHLTKKQRHAFDEMFASVKLYISACSNAAKPVRIYVILISLLLHHYLDLIDIADKLQMAQIAQEAIAE